MIKAGSLILTTLVLRETVSGEGMHGKSLCTVWFCCDPETALQKNLKMKEQGHARVRRT